MLERVRMSMLRSAGALVLVAVITVVLAPVAFAQDEGAVKVRVATEDTGFKCVPAPSANCLGEKDGDFVLEVQQGQLVELTFVWSHQGYVQDEHIIVLEGYRLETDKITGEHRESTIKFIADEPGNFYFKCDLECEVHDFLQRGNLKVSRSGATGGATSAPTFTKTNLSITPSLWITTGDPVQLMALLTDASGNPVPKSDITFVLNAEFAGTTAKMALGEARTDANGVAFFDYRPTMDMKQHAITAAYGGGGIYEGSEQAIAIEQLSAPPPAYETEPAGLEGFRTAARRSLFAGAIAVWTVFGFVLFRALSMVRNKEEQVAEVGAAGQTPDNRVPGRNVS